MFLSQVEIKELVDKGELAINPFETDNLNQVSYNLTLSEKVIDPETGEAFELSDFQLKAGQFVLANTQEYIVLPDNIVGFVFSRSSLARLGILTTLDAHLIEPSFEGSLTLALKNVSSKPVLLRPGLAVVQVMFAKQALGIYPDKKPAKYEGKQEVGFSKLCREWQDE